MPHLKTGVLATSLILILAVACVDGETGASPHSPTPDSPVAVSAPDLLKSPVPAGSTATPVPTYTPGPATTATSRPLSTMALEKAFPGLSFPRMVHLTYADDGTDLLFVVLQPGRVMVFENDRSADSAATFLDIRERVSDVGNEEGLLGLAFDPEYDRNGHFYVYYSSARPRRSVISRFSVSGDDLERADPDSGRIILEVPQLFSNHNGGHLVFGPDGLLYIGLGDGGAGGDPQGNGQDLSTLLGTILRIDVSSVAPAGTYVIPPDNPFVGNTGGAREEIWAYGLRNPWRFNFDLETGDLWAADVGQNAWEEIDLIKPGLNYGWNVMEGAHCYGRSIRELLGGGREGCDKTALEAPVIEYGREGGCSVTGGYVYRGLRLPSLYGAYVYGDFCSGNVWALRYDGMEVTEHLQIVDSGPRIPAFGEDRSGELYILSFDGNIYRLAPR